MWRLCACLLFECRRASLCPTTAHNAYTQNKCCVCCVRVAVLTATAVGGRDGTCVWQAVEYQQQPAVVKTRLFFLLLLLLLLLQQRNYLPALKTAACLFEGGVS